MKAHKKLPEKIPIWKLLVYICLLAATIIAGDIILYSHPVAGHILLTIAGLILLLTLLIVCISEFRSRKYRERNSEQTDKERSRRNP